MPPRTSSRKDFPGPSTEKSYVGPTLFPPVLIALPDDLPLLTGAGHMKTQCFLVEGVDGVTDCSRSLFVDFVCIAYSGASDMACLIRLLAALLADNKMDLTWKDGSNTDVELLAKVNLDRERRVRRDSLRLWRP